MIYKNEIVLQIKSRWCWDAIMTTMAVVWLAFLYILLSTSNKDIAFPIQVAEIAPLILSIILAAKIWQRDRATGGKILGYLFASSIIFFLVNIWYFVVYSVPHIVGFASIFDFVILLWFTLIILFMVNILWHYVIKNSNKMPYQHIFIIIFALIIADIAIFTLFSINAHYTLWSNVADMISYIKFIADLLIFDLSILLLVYSKNKGVAMIASGYIIIVASGFMFTSIRITKIPSLFGYGELLWFLGIIIVLFGEIYIVKNKNYNTVTEWFQTIATIKSNLTFWSFSVSFVSFILVFIFMKHFSVNHTIFIFFPSLIMLYSIVIGYISVLIANIFEAPFQQISDNIKQLMLNNTQTSLNTNFATEEFIFLHNFILEAFKYKEEKSRMDVMEQEKLEQEKFRKVVKQVMHDITSPVTSIQSIVSRLSSNFPETDRVTLKNAASRISGISHKLLSQYNDEHLKSEEEDLLVSLALLQIINEKREEYRESGIIFSVVINEESNFTFIKHNASAFKRMISNLINNAVDALKNHENGNITIILSEISDRIAIVIKDNGPGMPQHIVDKFGQGVGVTEGKKNGHGVGLTQVKDTITAGGGTHKVNASDTGTVITIWFPKIAMPNWLATEIKLTKDDTIVILDDDDSIHGSWNNNFKDLLEKNMTIKIEHFFEGKDAIAYINNLTSGQKQNTFLLTDYELLEQGINGLDVVLQTNMHRAILVTSYSADVEKQNEVMKAGIKMLPKELASHATVTVDKKLEKYSKIVDMVWVEDQKWYVDTIVEEHYKHLKVDVYYDPVSFMEEVHQYPLETRIILDTYYEYSPGNTYTQTGYDLARELHALGYTKLIIFTGEDPEGRASEYLQVVRKEDSYTKKNIDKI